MDFKHGFERRSIACSAFIMYHQWTVNASASLSDRRKQSQGRPAVVLRSTLIRRRAPHGASD